MYLREARIGHVSPFAVCFPSSRNVRPHGVGAQVEHVSVSSRAQYHSVRPMTLNFSSYQVSSDDSTRFAINKHQVHHFMTVVHGNFSFRDLTRKCRISTQKQLLTRLSFSVEGSRNQYSPERTVVEQTTIITGERNPLRYTLINDVCRHFRQAIHVSFARAVIASFDGIVEQAVG